MADDGVFELLAKLKWETDLTEVEQEVAQSLAKIQQKFNNLNPLSAGSAGTRNELVGISKDAIEKIRGYQQQLKAGTISAAEFATAVKNARNAAEQISGKLLGDKKIDYEIAVHLREGTLSPIKQTIQQAFKDLGPSLENEVKRLGQITSSNKKAFTNAYNQALSPPAAPISVVSGEGTGARIARPFSKEEQAAQSEGLQEQRAAQEDVSRITSQIKSQFQARFEAEAAATRAAEANAALVREEELAREKRTRQIKASFQERFKIEDAEAADYKRAQAANAQLVTDEENARKARTKQIQEQFKNRFQGEAEDRLKGLYSAPGVVNPHYTQIGPSQFSAVEDGQKRYFQVMQGGLHDITEDAARKFRALQKENARVASAAGGGGRGIGGSFVHGLFSGGFGGNSTGGFEGLAQAAGTTLKYTALYSALGALQGALGEVAAQTVNLADSETNLSLALEGTATNAKQGADINTDYRQSLEDIAAQAGSNVGDAMDIAAAGIRSVGSEANLTQDQLKQLSAQFLKQAQVQAINSKTNILDSSGNLRATLNAYSLGIEASERINDALANAKNIGGGDEAQTAQALASFAASAKEAGFSIEEAAALSSKVQAATDQTGSAVGNKLSRLVSIVSGSAGQAAIAQLNATLDKSQQVDTTADPRTQLAQLSKVFSDLDTAQRKNLTNALGGTSAYRELIVTLNSLNGIVEDQSGQLNKTGSAADEYRRRLGDLSAQVKIFQGSLQTIIAELAKGGVLDPLILGFKAIAVASQAIAAVVQDLNKMNPLLSKGAIYAGELALALTAISKIHTAGGVRALLASAEGVVAPQRALARQQLAGGAAAGAAEGAAAGAVRLAGKAGTGRLAAVALGGLEGAVAGLFNPITLAVGGFLAVGALRERAHEVDAAMSAAKGSLTALGKIDRSGSLADLESNYRNLASQTKTQATNLQDAANKRYIGILPAGATRTEQSVIDQNKTISDYAKSQADQIASEADKVNSAMGKLTVFGDPAALTAENVAAHLQELDEAGVGAATQMKLLISALSKTGTEANKVVRKRDVSERVAEGLAAIKQPGLDLSADTAGPVIQGSLLSGRAPSVYNPRRSNGANPFQGFFTGQLQAIQQSILGSLPDLASGGSGELNEGEKKKVIAAVTAVELPQYKKFLDTLDPFARSQQMSAADFTTYLADQVRQRLSGNVTAGGGPTSGSLAGGEINKIITESIAPKFTAAIDQLNPGDVRGKIQLLKDQVSAEDVVISRFREGDDVQNLQLAVAARNKAAEQLAEILISDDEKLRAAAQSRAKTLSAFRQIGRSYFNQEVKAAGSNVDLLVSIFENASKTEIAAAVASVTQAAAVAEAKYKIDQDTAKRIASVTAGAAAQGADGGQGQRGEEYQSTYDRIYKAYISQPFIQDEKNAAKRARAAANAARDAAKRTSGTTSSGSAYTGRDAFEEQEKALQQTRLDAANRLISRRNQYAVTSASLDQATRAVRDAKTRLDAYSKSDDGYWDALAAYHQSQDALAQAVKVDYADLERRLSIDLTNPIQTAQAELEKALDAQKLAKSQASRIKDPTARDAFLDEKRLDVRNARVAVENAKQQQFLSNLQTQESLGRISHTTYLKYLQSESDRVQSKLASMKNTDAGYFQLQQYSDQIAQDLKSAADTMNSQFNIGEIDVPTPYEVKRALKYGTGDIIGVNGAASAAGNVTNDYSQKEVVLNGVPINQVIKMIEDLFGKKARTKTARRYA